MAVQFLLDENVEREVGFRLAKFGHDAEHVQFLPELGEGTNDTPIAEFSRENEYVIVTYDDDFVREHTTGDFFGAVYFREADLSAKQVADVLHTMAKHYPKSAFEGLEYGSTDWL